MIGALDSRSSSPVLVPRGGSLHCVLGHNIYSQSASSLPDVNMGSGWWGITLQWTTSQYEVGNDFHVIHVNLLL